MGTGLFMRGTGVCKGVALTLQSIGVVDDFFPSELGSADVILGMQWLTSLGNMQINWVICSGSLCKSLDPGICKSLDLDDVLSGNMVVVLQGDLGLCKSLDLGLCKSLVSLKVMMRTPHHEGQGMLLELSNFGSNTSTPPFHS
ncbi:hypothetical protein PanWU01x14_217960 [Parasponia andersonii]|uniref:Uncharacterized protein n=1 Tax=Parasponia andersonii TaxID=3476 RepID=A0A2P5BR48_PARAD|nr:hypothetical protein PanWU01x14_217960 [Parasponia andersonii]